METKGPKWRGYISKLAQKTEVLGKILDNPDLELPPNVLHEIEEEMISAQAHLEAAWESAQAKQEADRSQAGEA